MKWRVADSPAMTMIFPSCSVELLTLPQWRRFFNMRINNSMRLTDRQKKSTMTTKGNVPKSSPLRTDTLCQGAIRRGTWESEIRVSDFPCFIRKQTGSRPNALSPCLYHDSRLRQEQGGEQRAEYFCSLHPDPSFLPVSRLVYTLVP